MANHFNLSRYKELLNLKKDNKISFLDENFRELLKYEVNVEKQIAYDRKEIYFLLISKFLNRSIEICDFESQLKELQKQDNRKSKIVLENFEELQAFPLASDLNIFSDSIYNISEGCFDYYESFVDLKPITKDELYDLVNKYYSQLQATFPTAQEIAESTKRNYEELVSRSFKVLASSLGLILGFNVLFLNLN